MIYPTCLLETKKTRFEGAKKWLTWIKKPESAL
jgi:hypothetical protein